MLGILILICLLTMAFLCLYFAYVLCVGMFGLLRLAYRLMRELHEIAGEPQA